MSMSTLKTPRFLHPDEEDPSKLINFEKNEFIGDGQGTLPAYNPNINRSIEQQRQRLPVFNYRNHILYLLERNRVLIIVGETGCGKSTQIPQYLYESGWLSCDDNGENNGNGKMIAITQPRRIAAVSLATRVAEEKSWILGQQVGYSIRFEECCTKNVTAIKYLTDGMLLREILRDPLLTNYRIVMIDEAHELTMNTDILLGLLKKILRKRPNDFRIIISSATLQAEKFRQFFNNLNLSLEEENQLKAFTTTSTTSKMTQENIDKILDEQERPILQNCDIISVQGRQYPIDICYTIDPLPCYVQATVETVLKLHQQEPMGGDVLVFVTGQDEVLQITGQLIDANQLALASLDSSSSKKNQRMKRLRALPLYGALPFRDQLKVFERPQNSLRKIIIATNIAEASLTLPNIVYVIDCGFSKIRAFYSLTGLEVLTLIPISKASANQRAGRAARVRAGKVYRLFTLDTYEQLQPHTPAEMERCDLSHAVLHIKAMGIDNFVKFDFFTMPPMENMERALELLYALGALDEEGRLTSPLGQRMAELPLHPMSSAMLFASVEFHCVKEVASICALLQIQNLFLIPTNQRKAAEKCRRKFACFEGDHLTQLNAFYCFERLPTQHRKSWCQSHSLNYKSLIRALQLREQIRHQIVERFRLPWSSCHGDTAAIIKSIVKGFFSQVAHLSGDGTHYLTVRGNHELHLHPNSVLYPEKWPKWVLFTDTILSSKLYMESVTVIEPHLLYTLAPHYYDYGTEREILVKTVAAYRTDSVF